MCRPGRNKNGTSCFSRDSPGLPPLPPNSAPLSSASAFSLLSECIECTLRRKCSMRIIAPLRKSTGYVCKLATRINAVENINLLILPVYLSVRRHSSYFVAFDGRCEEHSSFRFYSGSIERARVYKLPILPIFFRFFPYEFLLPDFSIVRAKFQARLIDHCISSAFRFNVFANSTSAGACPVIWNRSSLAKKRREKRKREREREREREKRVISS